MIDRERIKKRAKLIRPLFIPLILYIGLLTFAMFWLLANEDSPWRYVVVLTPMIPGIFIALGIVRMIGQLDEMERRILLEGAAFSFALTLILMLSLGFLEAAGMEPISGMYVAMLMASLWIIGKLWGNWRYR
jgi:hypothetical protein